MYKCQNCSKPATYFIKTNINGNIQETALCAECAAKQNIKTTNAFEDISGFFSPFFLGTSGSTSQVKRCPVCSATFKSICDTSKYGCPECYRTFADQSERSLKKLHGEIVHKGKRPSHVPQEKPRDELEELKIQLEEAVACENYEKAAELRDKIKLINSQKEGE